MACAPASPWSLEALIQRYARERVSLARVILAGVGTAQDMQECLNALVVVVWQKMEAFDPVFSSR